MTVRRIYVYVLEILFIYDEKNVNFIAHLIDEAHGFQVVYILEHT